MREKQVRRKTTRLENIKQLKNRIQSGKYTETKKNKLRTKRMKKAEKAANITKIETTKRNRVKHSETARP